MLNQMKIVDIEPLQICSILTRMMMQVRCDMLTELNAFPNLYMGVLSIWRRFRKKLNHFESGAPYEKWMDMPDMKYLMSSHYNVFSSTITSSISNKLVS